jgi:transcription elongation factor GreA
MVRGGDAQVLTITTGSRVRIRAGDHTEEEWVIVVPSESDAADSRLSELSPLGSALLGHGVGDEVRVLSPGGRWTALVIEVR